MGLFPNYESITINCFETMYHLKKTSLIIITLLLISCGKMRSENESNSESDKGKDETESTATQKKDSTYVTTTADSSETKGSILSESNFTKNPNEPIDSENANTKPQDAIDNKELSNPATNSKSDKAPSTTTKKVSTPSNFTIQKILNGCKTGETLSQEELSKNLEIPKDAIKLVKSITKISENEIDVKWNSTWAVEKISDAKFKDGRLKVRFENNKMYTSGNAIGIKYKRKIYTDLVVYGRAARIPSVKGFYWKIGRD